MSTKVLLKTMIPIALLVLVFLAAPIVSGKSALAPVEENAVNVKSQNASFKIDPRSASPKLNNLAGSDYIERHPSSYFSGSDYIERHPSVVTRTNFFVGSDWIERHPLVAKNVNFAGSDYIERHPSNFFAGSDYIERHPSVVNRDLLTGSDYIERHPSNYLAGSDYIERHPSVAAGSDWFAQRLMSYTANREWIDRNR